MQITEIEAFQVPPRWIFVRVAVDSGLVGWGECIVAKRARAVLGAVADLRENLLGTDAARIEDAWQRMFRGGFFRGGAVLATAAAAIDIALWDIKARGLGVPVYELLGGRVRDRVRLYAWVGGDRPSDVVAEVRGRAGQGFSAVKMNATEELHYLDSRQAIEKVVARVAAVRDVFGGDIDIALDCHGRVHRPMAKLLVSALAPFGLMWVEEPLLPENTDAAAAIFRAEGVPLATGERLLNRWEFKDVLQGRVFDIIQPDVSLTGLSEIVKISRMAEAYDLAVAPHCPNGPISLAATLQADACLPNVVIQEQSQGIHYNAGYRSLAAAEMTDYLAEPAALTPEAGYVTVPEGPGLGITVDEDRVRAAAAPWTLRDMEWRNHDGTLAEW